jgi:hypothetical protein
MIILAKLILIVFAVAASSVMTKVQAADSIVGTWRLGSVIEEETEGLSRHSIACWRGAGTLYWAFHLAAKLSHRAMYFWFGIGPRVMALSI